MKNRIVLYSLSILLGLGILQFTGVASFGSVVTAQTSDISGSKNIKKEKKKRMREQVKADKMALKRHQDIQTKATRKRMKKHLKKAKKNIKDSHR